MSDSDGENKNSVQLQHWVDFYENAWNKRDQFVEEIIQRGVSHPLELIESYYHLVSRQDIAKDNDYVDMNSRAPDKMPRYPNGKPCFRRIVTAVGYAWIPTYQKPDAFLADFLSEHEVEAVVELGSGLPVNLIRLYYKLGRKDIQFYAGEFTESGQRLGKRICDLDPNFKISHFFYDHKNPNLDAVKEGKKVLIFSHHSIEQIHMIPEDFFEKLTPVAEHVIGVHMEPFGFQIAQKDEGEVKDIVARHTQQFFQNKWNTNFLPVFVEASKRGTIVVKFVGRNVMGMGHENPTSIAIWESKKSS